MTEPLRQQPLRESAPVARRAAALATLAAAGLVLALSTLLWSGSAAQASTVCVTSSDPSGTSCHLVYGPQPASVRWQ